MAIDLAEFDDVDDAVRFGAGLATASARDDEDVPRLVALLEDARPRVRSTALYTLGQLATSVETAPDSPHKRAVESTFAAVHARFGDGEAQVRGAAFSALFFYGPVQRDRARWFSVACDGLASDDPDVRATAAMAVHRFDPTSELAARGFARILEEDERPMSNGWQEAAMMLEEMGSAGAPAVSALLARFRATDRYDDLWSSLLAALDAIGTVEALSVVAENSA